MDSHTVTENDLHAYADGFLDPARRIEVEAYLAEDKEAAAKVAAWRAQADVLRTLFDPVLKEPPTDAMTALRDGLAGRMSANENRPAWRQSPFLMRTAAAVALVVAGTAGGWFGANMMDARRDRAAPPAQVAQAPQTQPLQNFAAAAVRAHNFYTVDSPYMVEIDGRDRDALNGWVSERLGKPVVGPDLSDSGFNLVGGRALPSATGPSAQYMYQDEHGNRLTLFVGAARPGQEGVVSVYEQGDVTGVYWLDGPTAYALIGRLGRDRLMEITQTAQRTIREAQDGHAPAGEEPPAKPTNM